MNQSNPSLISSTKNPKIVNLRKLKQRKHRRTQNRFMVEGLQLISMAQAAGHRPLDVFYCREQFTGQMAPVLLQRLLKAGGHPYPVADPVMNILSDRDTPQGIITTFPLFEASIDTLFSNLAVPAFFLVLDRLQDPGNLGTLIRTADAIAATGVILIEPCVDLFDPKTVRGSMGSLFTIPLVHTDSPPSLFALLNRHQVKLIGADSHRGEFPWAIGNEAMLGSIALILGNEARGLSPGVQPHLADWVHLPMLGQAESLNVAAAGAVLMYQWLQRNRDLDLIRS